MRWVAISMGIVVSSFAGLAIPAAAQSTLDWPVGVFQTYPLDSGPLGNSGDQAAVVFSTDVVVKDAVWVRLYFGAVLLEHGSFVRMTAAADHEVQELDAESLSMWSYTSAYFNGDRVTLELVAAPGATQNRVVLDRVAVQIVEGSTLSCGVDGCGYCGSDDRVPSSEDWAGRLLPVGCTGSVYDTNSCIVSAGHCADGGFADVIQFRVPNSRSDCSPVNPGVADQFPITGYMFTNGGVGNDWSVMTTGTNNQGQTAYQRYGVLRPIASAPGNVGNPVAVWGFGVDDSPSPTRSQTQQTASGQIATRHNTYYTFTVDITYGNSGSALILNGEIIGIVTHCPCPNIATRVDLQAFVNARQQLCGDSGGGYCPASSNSSAFEYIGNVNVGSINNTSGASTYSDFTYISTQLTRGQTSDLSLTLGSPSSSDIGGLWIDWNQNDDFADAGEAITTAWSGSGPYTATIPVPATAALGPTRLRVRIQDATYDPTVSPCDATSYGEVEDYTVYVVDPVYYALTLNILGQGTVTLDPPGAYYPAGTTVQLTANPSAGWHFYRWETDLNTPDNPTTIVMNGNKTVTAVFMQDTHPGDMNCDGQVNNFDISAFVQAVSDPYGYVADHPDCNWLNGDINGDGNVDNFDITPFVRLLTGS